MKRILLASLVVAVGLQAAAGPAAARPRAAAKGEPERVAIVLGQGFPIHRPFPSCVVHRPQRAIIDPYVVYGPPVLWMPVIVPLPSRPHVVWEDGETLVKREGWADVQMNVKNRGIRLYLELTGRTQLEFADIMFATGEGHAVDFDKGVYKPGIYTLFDFSEGHEVREVRYVRLVARAKGAESRLIVRMER